MAIGYLSRRIGRASGHLYPWWVIACLSIIILAVLSPQWILADNTPSGGDMGAHVLGPAALRDILLPEGRLMGWSNAWFAGFPLFYFYFPLPSLVIVALDVLMPYGVAFKLVTVGGLLLLPFSVYFLSRSIKLPEVVSVVSAATGVMFALMEGFTIYGGNVASTLAGEFSYSWSFSLGFIYLGLLIRVIDGERRLIPATVAVFAVTALCHILTTLMLVIGTLVFLAMKKSRFPLMITSAWAFCIAAFWAVPLVINLPHSSDMAWDPLTEWSELFPSEMWVVVPLFPVGVVWALRRGRRIGEAWKIAPLLAMTLVPLLYYPLPIFLTKTFPGLFFDEHWKLYNGRLLPYWYFGVAYFAMLAVGAGVQVAARRLPRRMPPVALFLIPILATALLVWAFNRFSYPPDHFMVILPASVLIGTTLAIRGIPVATGKFLAVLVSLGMAASAWAGVSFLQDWSEWNYSGYENKDDWGEYRDMNTLVSSLEPGRVLWENNNGIDKYGTPMAPMLIPYWSDWSHPSMEGLYFESSISMPFLFITIGEMSSQSSNPVGGLRYHNLAMSRGLEHMEMFGVRYYLSYTPEATAEARRFPELRELGSAEPFYVFEAPPTELVEVARFQPSVYQETPRGEPDFFNFSLTWFDAVHLSHLWVVEEGPPGADWPVVSRPSELRPIRLPDHSGAVRNIRVEDHRISFDTEAIGLPHLVKVSYFPNWRAKGAEGPYLVAPSLMMVIPTEESVVIEFGNRWVEWLGWTLTLVGILAVAVPRWRRKLVGCVKGAEGNDEKAIGVVGDSEPIPQDVAEGAPVDPEGD